jgi:hypothetical protein
MISVNIFAGQLEHTLNFELRELPERVTQKFGLQDSHTLNWFTNTNEQLTSE